MCCMRARSFGLKIDGGIVSVVALACGAGISRSILVAHASLASELALHISDAAM
jgi:hypothetical protein